MSKQSALNTIIQAIHATNIKIVLVSSGGGTNAIASFLRQPGASNTILESYIPYSRESLAHYLLRKPEQYCSLDTTLSMAAKAFSAAKKIDTTSKNTLLYGIGITASLATLDDKKGDHRFHIVIQGQKFSKSISCILKKGLRTREEEESLITEYVIYLVAEVSGLKYEMPKHQETPEISNVIANKDWIKLMDHKIDFVSSSKLIPEIIFPGRFNPIHSGHFEMKQLAENKTGMQVSFEICIQNADKPPMSYHEIQDTLSQFSETENWVLTKAGMFIDKARMFPNCVFIIGADTLVRILDEKFYASRKDMMNQLDLFNAFNNNFLVFGRKIGKKFITLSEVNLPDHIANRFTGFAEDVFRDDISSTILRQEKIE